MYVSSRPVGFTLLELIVVLLLLSLAAGIVAPTLLSIRPEGASELESLVGSARQAAIRRGERVRLEIDRSGLWQAVTETPSRPEVLMSGRLVSPPSKVYDLLFSPLGTCGPSLESAAPETVPALDPLTCEGVPP